MAEHTEMYVQIALGKLDLKKIKPLVVKGGNLKHGSISKTIKESFEALYKKVAGKKEELIIGDNIGQMDYKLSPCCNPIPGDSVFGFVTINDGIKIHRNNCPNAKQMRANNAYRVINAKWKSEELSDFLTGIRFTGIDDIGLVNEITSIISSEKGVNMKAVSFDSNDGIFEGKVMLYINSIKHLTDLMKHLKSIEGIKTIERIDTNEEG